jgi:hypothetical protein
LATGRNRLLHRNIDVRMSFWMWARQSLRERGEGQWRNVCETEIHVATQLTLARIFPKATK